MSNTRFMARPWWTIAAGGCAMAVVMLMVACASNNATHARQRFDVNSSAGVTADPQIRNLLVTSCFDCHSDQAPAAWNARLAPSYLFGADKARRVLNFSEWQSYGARKRMELEAIAKVVSDGSMPPGDYDFVHPAAKLSTEQKKALLEWVSAQNGVPSHVSPEAR
jgi:cytochrome c553